MPKAIDHTLGLAKNDVRWMFHYNPNRCLTGSILADNLVIFPETGRICWTMRKKRVEAGRVAGVIKRGPHSQGGGYRIICIDQKQYRAHHLVWVWVYGEWPSVEIDHINGNRDDNRIENLRLATASQNRTNKVIQSNNKSGFKWVYKCSQTGKWRAEINSNTDGSRKRLHQSLHSTPEEAYDAACAAAKKLLGKWYNSGEKK
jgi:hypothetical protein